MTSEETVKTYAANLNRLLVSHDISQRKFADMSGINYKTLLNYISGHSMPSPDKMLIISRYFNVSIDRMLQEDMVDGYVPTSIQALYDRLDDKGKEAAIKYIYFLLEDQ